MVDRFLQPENAPSPIFVTLEGSVIDVIPVLPKAEFPIVIKDGALTEVRFVQLENTQSPIFSTSGRLTEAS